MTLYSEIHEQPDVLRRACKTNLDVVREISRAVGGANSAFIAARGTSDNAARYAKYLWGAMNKMPVTLAAPSLFSLYRQPPNLSGALVVGISQSGESPDILAVLAEGRRQGCLTLAITNKPDSPLAEISDFVLDIQAGEERAVAATKTYTTQLLAIAQLAAGMAGDTSQFEQIDRLPGWIDQVLTLDNHIAQLALRFRFMQHCVVLGRGYNYATAFEWSLKLKELTYVVAEPYSSADFMHGPIAMVAGGFPVMAIAPRGVVFPDMLNLLQRLKDEYQAELVVVSDHPSALELATSPILLPEGIPESLTPIVGIVPAQLFCYNLTRIKGFDTKRPRGLRKVTHTH